MRTDRVRIFYCASVELGTWAEGEKKELKEAVRQEERQNKGAPETEKQRRDAV